MSGNGGGVLCGVCFCFIVIPSIIMISMSFSSLPTVEYGLDYNAITLTVDNKTYGTAGLYFLGLGHSFIKFPRTIQTIEFNAAHRDLLHTRTLDGLPLTLGVSFQFRYIPQHLYELYRAYKLNHLHVYENTATAVIANVACNYSAYTFFNDKQGIATVMEDVLRSAFAEKLYAEVDALQINYIQLPTTFQDAILESISTKQNITQSRRYKENMQAAPQRPCYRPYTTRHRGAPTHHTTRHTPPSAPLMTMRVIVHFSCAPPQVHEYMHMLHVCACTHPVRRAHCRSPSRRC